ncbi:hypothetical protein, partial [Photobacterium halotolerans]|uniref:hypothetical protein n=1 Tax=Photobacterium halotolerans TaxID=265726 RepID=UPI0005633B5D
MANYQQFMEMRRKEYEAREAEKNTGIIGDLADMAHAGAASSLGGIVDFLGDEKTAQRLYQNADEQYETLTPEMRESMGKEFFGEDEQGLYAGEALTDPRAWAGNLAKVAGGMAPAIVGGGAAGLVGRGLVSTVASGGTNAFLNGAMANGQAADQVRQNVINADMTQLAQNELFKSVVRTFHEQNPDMESAALLENAKLEFAEQAAKVRMYDPASFASNALLGMFGDRAIVGALAKGSKASTVTGAIGRNALIEGGTEFVQEAGDQVATNLVNRDYVDPNTGATDNALSAGLTGAVLGGGMGAAAGGVGHALHGNRGTNVPQNKNITDPATNDTTDVIDSAPQQAEQAPEATGAQPGQVDLTGGTIVPQERTEPVMGDLSGVYEPAPIDPEALDVSSTWDNDEPMIGTIAAPDEPLKGTPIDVSGTQGLGEPVADRETIVPQVDKETQLREQAEAERAAQPPTPELSDPVKGRVEQRAQERMAKIQESAYRADALDDPIEPVGNVGKDEREAERLKDLQLKNNPTRQAKLSKEQAERDKAKADAEAKKRGKFQQNALRDREGERLVPRNDDEYLGKLAQRMLEAQEGKKGAPTVDELLAEAKAEGATQKQVHDAIQAKRAE